MTTIFNILYTSGMLLGGPIYWLLRLARRKPTPPFLDRLWRFPRPKTSRPVVWIHGVSLGEIMSARGLVNRLTSHWPDHEVVISSTTTTGLQAAREHFPNHVVFACPFDLGLSVSRAQARLDPHLLILIELEIWPNLIRRLGNSQTPIVVVNGRISARSAKGYRRLLGIIPRFLDPISRFLVQRPVHASRLAQLSVDKQRIEVLGNLKVDNLSIDLKSLPAPNSKQNPGSRLIFVAGSTHEGEDLAVLRAYLEASRVLDNLKLILAPRHLERLGTIESFARKLGIDTVRSEYGSIADDNKSVVLLNSIGELPALFHHADVVFLGGSLVPVGGHNVLEPAAAGVVQILGPYTASVSGLVEDLESVGAAYVVRDEAGLTRQLQALLIDAPRRKAGGLAAIEVVTRHRGVLDRTIKALDGYRSRS